MTLQGKGRGVSGTPKTTTPPVPPASGGGGEAGGLGSQDCPRCSAVAGEPCTDRNGKVVRNHTARGRVPGRKRYDPEVEKFVAKLPGYDPHQVYGAVITIRQAQRWVKRSPEVFADLPKPVLTVGSVAEKVQALYKWEAVIPSADREGAA